MFKFFAIGRNYVNAIVDHTIDMLQDGDMKDVQILGINLRKSDTKIWPGWYAAFKQKVFKDLNKIPPDTIAKMVRLFVKEEISLSDEEKEMLYRYARNSVYQSRSEEEAIYNAESCERAFLNWF